MHGRRVPAAAVAADAEGGRLVEGGPVGHAAAERLEDGLRVVREVRHDLLAQEAAVAVLQHLRAPAPTRLRPDPAPFG